MSAYPRETTLDASHTAGSQLSDRLYREARQAQLDPNRSVLRVYLCGYVYGALRAAPLYVSERVSRAMDIYTACKAEGMHHGEALDEVLLAGYVVGRAEKLLGGW